jgi:hypothetical protein
VSFVVRRFQLLFQTLLPNTAYCGAGGNQLTSSRGRLALIPCVAHCAGWAGCYAIASAKLRSWRPLVANPVWIVIWPPLACLTADSMRQGQGKPDERRFLIARPRSAADVSWHHISDQWSRSAPTDPSETRFTKRRIAALWSGGQVKNRHRRTGMGWYIRITSGIRASEP